MLVNTAQWEMCQTVVVMHAIRANQELMHNVALHNVHHALQEPYQQLLAHNRVRSASVAMNPRMIVHIAHNVQQVHIHQVEIARCVGWELTPVHLVHATASHAKPAPALAKTEHIVSSAQRVTTQSLVLHACSVHPVLFLPPLVPTLAPSVPVDMNLMLNKSIATDVKHQCSLAMEIPVGSVQMICQH